jgi:nucleotide-binding universal stress UspA family protein
MRNVLVLVHEDDGQESRMQAALAVTRAVSGHLSCLDVFMVPVIMADPWTGYADTTVIKDAMEDDAAHRTKIEQKLAKEDVAWTMLKVTGDPADALREAAELADLIVVTSHGSPDSVLGERAIVGAVVTKTGRPVLAVPPGYNSFDVTGRALIAWDGSHEANQAIRAATPLLALAEEVTVLIVNEAQGEFSAEEAGTYLSRHGIVPRIIARDTADPIAKTILEQARLGDASYIVMGAFGSSRMVEAVFGGVTRSIITESPIPVLLAH